MMAASPLLNPHNRKTLKDITLKESLCGFSFELKYINGKSYTFYDGPPFATGLPHYGHILAGLIKDTIIRWAVINGYDVPRRAGFDCHGLPIEFEIEKRNRGK